MKATIFLIAVFVAIELIKGADYWFAILILIVATWEVALGKWVTQFWTSRKAAWARWVYQFFGTNSLLEASDKPKFWVHFARFVLSLAAVSLFWVILAVACLFVFFYFLMPTWADLIDFIGQRITRA